MVRQAYRELRDLRGFQGAYRDSRQARAFLTRLAACEALYPHDCSAAPGVPTIFGRAVVNLNGHLDQGMNDIGGDRSEGMSCIG